MRPYKNWHHYSGILLLYGILLASCGPTARIARLARQNILDSPGLASAHIGISVYDASSGKYLYRHNSGRYFIPASNTKIVTCFAAMSYLGDSLPGVMYRVTGDTLVLVPTGDPTFLHPDFTFQPVLSFLRGRDSSTVIAFDSTRFREKPWGAGWSWDDYAEDYMPERSAMPVHGNVVTFSGKAPVVQALPPIGTVIQGAPGNSPYISRVDRSLSSNIFTLHYGGSKEKAIDVPFYTDSGQTNFRLLQEFTAARWVMTSGAVTASRDSFHVLYSQPTDSLLSIMMHRSDNFYAEQSLLMVSNILLGYMNDEAVIDTLLKTDLSRFPERPQWVDGSGLSRYNLFTPDDFVFVLEQIKNRFGWSRITKIFATGGSGTLTRYTGLENRLYAKTGTLSNNAALSGYLLTGRGKVLIFSILTGNHLTSGTSLRKSMYGFLSALKDAY